MISLKGIGVNDLLNQQAISGAGDESKTVVLTDRMLHHKPSHTALRFTSECEHDS